MTTPAPPTTPRRPVFPSVLPKLPQHPSNTPTKVPLPSVRLSLCVPTMLSSTPLKKQNKAPLLPILIQGFLSKRSQARFWPSKKPWTNLWIVIDRTKQELRYYNDSEVMRHPEIKPKKIYSMEGVELLVKDNENSSAESDSGRARYSFFLILNEGNKKIEMGCTTIEERQRWTEFIEATIKTPSTTTAATTQEDKNKENKNSSNNMTTSSNIATPININHTAPLPPPKPTKKNTPTTPAAETTPTPTKTPSKVRTAPSQHPPPIPVNPSAHTTNTPNTITTPTIPAINTTINSIPITKKMDSGINTTAASAPPMKSLALTATSITNTNIPPPSSAITAALMKHHELHEKEAATVGSLSWNQSYQSLLTQARSSPSLSNINKAVIQASYIKSFVIQFEHTAEKWARRIIEEYTLPHHMKTVKPTLGTPDDKQAQTTVAYLMEGIGFTIAQGGTSDTTTTNATTENQAKEGIPSSSSACSSHPSAAQLSLRQFSDRLSSKRYTHELHAVTACNTITLPSSICLPLMCIIDYLGYRICATATLPIYSNQSLVWGRTPEDGSYRTDNTATQLLTELATALNISPYEYSSNKRLHVPLSCHIQLYHCSTERRYYLMKLATLFPVDVDVLYGAQHQQLQLGWQTKRFRAEFISHYHTSLISDVYTYSNNDQHGGVSNEDNEIVLKDEAAAATASKFLQETILPRIVKSLDKLVGGYRIDIPDTITLDTLSSASSSLSSRVYACLGSVYPEAILDGSDLCRQLHLHGVNLRYLARIAEMTRIAYLRQLCAIEMIARTCRGILDEMLRSLRNNHLHTISPHLNLSSVLLLQYDIMTRCCYGTVSFMNLILGTDTEADQFWEQLLYPDVCAKYNISITSTSSSSSSSSNNTNEVYHFPLTLAYFRSLHKPLLFHTLQQRCHVIFQKKSYPFDDPNMQGKPIVMEDFLCFLPYIKSTGALFPPHSLIISARRRVCAAETEMDQYNKDTLTGSNNTGNDVQADEEKKQYPLEIDNRIWTRYCRAMEIQLMLEGGGNSNNNNKDPSSPAATSTLSSSIPSLRVYNELIYAYLQSHQYDRAEDAIQQAYILVNKYQSIISSTSSSSSILMIDNNNHHQYNTLFLFSAEEQARLSINMMWLYILTQSASKDTYHIRTSRMFTLFNSVVKLLSYAVGMKHPLMLSVHFTLAYYYIQETLYKPSSSSSSSSIYNISNNERDEAASQIVPLLDHCLRFSRALFTDKKPLTKGIEQLLSWAKQRTISLSSSSQQQQQSQPSPSQPSSQIIKK